jgi:hypothetical protein
MRRLARLWAVWFLIGAADCMMRLARRLGGI